MVLNSKLSVLWIGTMWVCLMKSWLFGVFWKDLSC